MRQKKKILFIGYDRNLLVLHGGALQKLGNYEITAADSAQWGKELYCSESFDVVVLGSGLSTRERQALVDDIRQINSGVEIVMLPEALFPWKRFC